MSVNIGIIEVLSKIEEIRFRNNGLPIGKIAKQLKQPEGVVDNYLKQHVSMGRVYSRKIKKVVYYACSQYGRQWLEEKQAESR